MLLTPDQLYEIRQIIEEHHTAFMVNTMGQDTVPPEVLEKLRMKGLVTKPLDSIGEAYTYGQLLATLENQKTANMSYGEFKNYLRANPVPLTELEQGARDMAAQSAGQYCRGLGNRVDVATGAILIEADRQLRARMESDIRDATQENIARRQSVEQLKSDLGWATKDWSRDLKRIAITEKVTAMNQGTSDHFKKRYGADTLVTKRVMPDACDHCKRLYIGTDGNPRVFKLSTLEANGTNVGVRVANWKAVIGATHPNCQCIMIRVPAGWGFDEFGDLVPGGKLNIYESPEELALAMMQEDDLQKAFQLQGHVNYQGIPIAIENKEGSIRRWGDFNGEHGETKMQGVSYGYVKGTMGADEDEIDVFVGPDPRAGMVYVIEQQNPHNGIYDEQKCMLGFPNQHTAEQAYRLHYDDPDRFIIAIQPMDIDQFKRWVEVTKPQKGEMIKARNNDAQNLRKANDFGGGVGNNSDTDTDTDTKLVVLIPERLEKAAAKGGKYIRRVPYYKDGKRKYRYYYRESAAARDVTEGETIKLGKQFAEVVSVADNGNITLSIGGNQTSVAPQHWDKLLSRHYGDTYYKWATKRAQQSVNAVLKRVPREHLKDLKGDTDTERLADLQKRVPKVYSRLQKSFQRAGVNPLRAKEILSASLERRGWEPEARAAVIGDVITKRNQNYQTTIKAAENLAGGGPVSVGHVGAVTEIVQKVQSTEKDELTETLVQAEQEMSKLSSLLAKARAGNDTDKAKALAAALSSQAMQLVKLTSEAFPGLQDKAVEPVRETLEQVPSIVPKAPLKSVGSSTSVIVAGEGGLPKTLAAKYRLVEADDAIASHDPRTFNRRKDYPEDVQERAYHRDKAEQAKVQRNAQRLMPEFVVNTNPDAVNGAPIMGADGAVLGGNSRTMSMQLVYAKHPEKAKELKGYLRKNAYQAGFTEEDVDQFKNPILVREIEHSGETLRDKQMLVRQMNESFTQGMDPRTMQVAMGRKLSDQTLTDLGGAMGSDEALNKFLDSKRAEPFIGSLQREGVIDQRNASLYFEKGTKKLNQDGKTLVSRILMGRTVGDADLLSSTKTGLVNNIAQGTPFITQAKAYGGGYDLTDDIKTAITAYNSLQYRVATGDIPALDKEMTAYRFDHLFGQQDIEGEHPIVGKPRAMGLLELFIRAPGRGGSSPALTNTFRRYAEKAAENPEGQGSMFGPAKTPTELFMEAVDDHIPKQKEEAQGGLFKSDTEKSWGYFVGPKGGKWKDPGHTIPWVEPKKETGRKKLGDHNPESGDVAPLPGQVDIYEYTHEIKPKRVASKLTPSQSMWAETAWDDLAGPIREWIHRPSTGKAPIMDAYQNLSKYAKEGLAAETKLAIQKTHGTDTFTAWRRKKNTDTKDWGGMSVTTDKRNVGSAEYEAVQIQAKDVLVHWAQGGPLGGSFAHEKEVILKPTATPTQLQKSGPIRTPILENQEISKAANNEDQVELDTKVLPEAALEKARTNPEIAMRNSPAGNRAPGPGLGINHVIMIPKKKGGQGKKEKGYFPTKEELLDKYAEEGGEGALHVDKEIYDFSEQQRMVKPLVVPEAFVEAGKDAREGSEERMEYVKKEAENNAQRPKNKVVRTPVK